MTFALPPVWISSDLQSLDLPGVNASFDDLINKSQDLIEGVFAPVKEGATSASEINDRLRAWYSQQIEEEQTNPIQDLAASFANFIENTWNTGVHVYLTIPDYGGIDHVRSSLVSAMQSNDVNAPRFSDEMLVSGAVLMFSGGRAAMFTACSTLLMLLGADRETVTSQIQLLVERSSPVSEIVDQVQDMGREIQQNWNDEQKELAQWFKNSSINKILTGEAYPFNLIKQAIDNASAPRIVFGPERVVRGQEFTFTLALEPGRTVGQDAVIYIGNLRLDGMTINGHLASKVISASDWPLVGNFLNRVDVRLLQKTQGGLIPITTLGTIEIERPGLNGIADIFKAEPAFESWRSFTIGDTTANLIPGSAGFARDALSLLDQIAAPTDAGEDFVGRAILSASQMATSTLSSASRLADGINDTITGQLDEFTALNVSAMVVPPAEGGNHQLIFSLNQGLRLEAPDAPPAFEDQVSFALFVCAGVDPALAGANDAKETLQEVVQQVGLSFGVRALAEWVF